MTTPRPRSARGFTLLELLITAVVLGTAFIAATWSLSATARTKELYDRNETPAFMLAKEIQELADGLPRAPAGTTAVTSFADVAALDALEGAVFSPPIYADGSPASEYGDWTQQVDLSIYALDDPSTPTALDPAAGLPADSAHVYRLEVLMRQNGQDIDSFHWWIHP